MSTPRIKNVAYYNGNQYSSFQKLSDTGSMHGAKRVIIFCIMTTVLPTILIIIPLYLRHIVYADVVYTVAKSDVVEVTQGISSIFCNAHSLQMNSSFNAFQLHQTPRINTKRKHIRLKKSMTLPDDTLEFWGFYLLEGATVNLKVCSRYQGSSILLVRGERNLQTCGLMDHNLNKLGGVFNRDHNQVKVTFESAEEIQDENLGNEDVDTPNQNAAVEDTSNDDNLNINFNKSNGSFQNFLSRNSSVKNKVETNFTQQVDNLKQILDESSNKNSTIKKRDITGHLYDSKIEHGGNALNYSKSLSNENSVSSFETSLMDCYNDDILLAESFPPSHLCQDVHYLEKGERMETVHDIIADGYYYYIFYSDNDYISNDIHAIFDIYKPTLLFANITKSKACVNSTECSFPIPFWSYETVIVEVPTRDGIDHKGDDDIIYLTSTCHPRMAIYVIFPIAIMFFILGCAFI